MCDPRATDFNLCAPHPGANFENFVQAIQSVLSLAHTHPWAEMKKGIVTVGIIVR